jgi:hypothetical protein
MAANSWNGIENKTIANCFAKAGFAAAHSEQPESGPIDSDVGWEPEDDLPLWNMVRDRLGLASDMTFADYASVDTEIETTDNISADEFFHHLTLEPNWDSENDSNTDEKPTPEENNADVLPTTKEAIKSIETLRRYFESVDGAKNEDFESISNIESSLLTSTIAKQKQKQITDFFPRA